MKSLLVFSLLTLSAVALAEHHEGGKHEAGDAKKMATEACHKEAKDHKDLKAIEKCVEEKMKAHAAPEAKAKK